MNKSNILQNIYYNPRTGYGTALALYQRVKDKGFTYEQVKQWYAKQEGNQIFATNRKVNYPAIIGMPSDYQADLMFLDQYARQNNGYHVILNIIELTTRKAYSYKMKDKSTASIIEAMKAFLSKVKVHTITTDNGSEFTSRQFKQLMEKYGVNHVTVDVDDKTKMGKVERMNRTVRDKITKYMKTNKTLRWEDVLQDLIDNYNDTVHSSTGYKPNEVTPTAAAKIRLREQERSQLAYKEIKKFKPGQKIRIMKKKKTFQKGANTFTKSIYEIHKVDKLALIVKDKNGSIVERRIKPYHALIVDEVEKAPEKPEVEKHSSKENNKINSFIRKQRKEFDINTETGEAKIPKRLELNYKKEEKVEEDGPPPESDELIGKRISVYWPDYKKYYPGTIVSKHPHKGKYNIKYDDEKEDAEPITEKLYGPRRVKWMLI